VDPLQYFHQQLKPAHLPNVAGDLVAVHPQLARLHSKGLDLLVGDPIEGPVQQVLPHLGHVLDQPSPEVVDGAQVEVALGQVPVTQGIPDLEVEAEGIVHLGVAPAKPALSASNPTRTFTGTLGLEGSLLYRTTKGRSSKRQKNSL